MRVFFFSLNHLICKQLVAIAPKNARFFKTHFYLILFFWLRKLVTRRYPARIARLKFPSLDTLFFIPNIFYHICSALSMKKDFLKIQKRVDNRVGVCYNSRVKTKQSNQRIVRGAADQE